MVNQYLFIEQGSLTPSDINKLVENTKNTGTSLMMYNKGCAKPELVSIGDITEKRDEYTLDDLKEYLEEVLEQHMESRWSDIHLTTEKYHKLSYYGSFDELIKGFEEFLRGKGK